MNKIAAIKLGHTEAIIKGITFDFSQKENHVVIIGDLAEDGYDYKSTVRMHVDDLKHKIKSVYYGDKYASIELNVLDIKLHPFNKKCFIMALSPIKYENALYDNVVIFMMVNEIGAYPIDPENNLVTRSEFKSYFM